MVDTRSTLPRNAARGPHRLRERGDRECRPIPRSRLVDLEACVGCSLGAIYNLVADLEELVLRVSQRTLAALDAELDAVYVLDSIAAGTQLLAWSKCYAAFAASYRNL